MKKDDLIIPRIDGLLLTQIPEVQQFWIKREDARAAEKSDLTAECLLCGETRPIARTHPVELVVGPDRVGLVTGNAKAFLSHGLEQSEIAPVCQRCARTYGEALRYLLEQDRHHQRISDVTWVYWTAEATDFTPFNTLMEADARNIEALLKAPYKAQPSGDVDETAFYAAALTSNISRLAIRSWVATTVGEVKQNIAQHFAQMRLDGPDGSHYHGVYALAGSTVRDLNDLPPHTIETLLSHALMGTRLPKTLLQKAIRRAQVEGAITHPRAALLKLVLLSNQSNTVTPMLNPTHDNPAYHCGRLLAVLESIQKRAISPNTTLVDRYYGTASTAPASVFGNLMRDAQTHLSKLRRGDSDGGLGFHFDKQLGAIMGQMDGFPRTLNTEDQALFALGYYQQKWHHDADDEDSDQEEGTNASATAAA
jgi:CRISPR-associated protein Csd1